MSLRRLLSIATIAFSLWTGPRISYAQAAATATQAGGAQLGVAYSFASPDYGDRNIQGYTIYGDFNFTRHWGIEGDVHQVNVVTPGDISEDSYLLGPRYTFRFRRFHPYAKGLLGLGRFNTDYDKGFGRPNVSYTYKIYALGGGVDIPISQHVNIRAVDFEYQGWPGFGTNGLSPYVFSFGTAYRFR